MTTEPGQKALSERMREWAMKPLPIHWKKWAARFLLLIFAIPFVVPILLVFGLVELAKWIGRNAEL